MSLYRRALRGVCLGCFFLMAMEALGVTHVLLFGDLALSWDDERQLSVVSKQNNHVWHIPFPDQGDVVEFTDGDLAGSSVRRLLGPTRRLVITMDYIVRQDPQGDVSIYRRNIPDAALPLNQWPILSQRVWAFLNEGAIFENMEPWFTNTRLNNTSVLDNDDDNQVRSVKPSFWNGRASM